MVAVPKWASLRTTVLADARQAHGKAHLESPEVPQWLEEAGAHDLVGALSEALSETEGKPRDAMCALLVKLCKEGDEISQRRAVDLIDGLRAMLTDYCIEQAQRMVDRELS